MRSRALTGVLVAVVVLGACTSSTEETTTTEAADSSEDAAGETTVDIAAGNEDFSTLVTAVTEAGVPWSRAQLYQEMAAAGELDLRLMAMSGSVLADGGDPAQDFGDHVEADEWKGLVEKFLLTQGYDRTAG
mgnify:CR=1 FL=1